MSPGFHVGDCLDLLAQMPPESVHCCVTSPPYYALRSYLPEGHPGKAKEIGSEPTLDAFLATMVTVFRAVWRVLRDDGTLWLNIGDSYAAGATKAAARDRPELTGGGCGTWSTRDATERRGITDLPPKNLLMVPARVALALQADGWILRSDIIWSKPNPMPESCRDRPTNAHEHMFLFAKRLRYFYDGDAVREGVTGNAHGCGSGIGAKVSEPGSGVKRNSSFSAAIHNRTSADCPTSRNLRNVWTIPTQAVKFKHYATFPEKLVEPCIKAGTSQEGVCVECGAPWERVVEIDDHAGALGKSWHDHKDDEFRGQRGVLGVERMPHRTTTGWRPTCGCDAGTKPALVLDPFMGSGTVARVCERLGREWIGFDLDERNREMCEKRLRRVQKELLL